MAYNTSYQNVFFKNYFENNFFPFNFLCKQFFFFKTVVQTIFFPDFPTCRQFFLPNQVTPPPPPPPPVRKIMVRPLLKGFTEQGIGKAYHSKKSSMKNSSGSTTLNG